jgi:hypothetical protein
MGKGRLKTCIMGIGMGMGNYPQKWAGMISLF